MLKRNGLPPAPTRSKNTSWADFIRAHSDCIVACDFFTAEVLNPDGPVTFYVLFFVHRATRKVRVAGVTEHPNEEWMNQVARNETMAESGFLNGSRYLIHDRDTKNCASFRKIVRDAGVEPLKLPPRSPNLNPVAERWVRSVKSETLSRLLVFSEESLRETLRQYVIHFHEERNHQSFENRLLFPRSGSTEGTGQIATKERLGGLLRFYQREAA